MGTLAQSIREKHHQVGCEALNNDIVDIIASDHAPHTLDEKSKIAG